MYNIFNNNNIVTDLKSIDLSTTIDDSVSTLNEYIKPSNRYNHINQVALKMVETTIKLKLHSILNLDEDDWAKLESLLIQIAYLHDIGYSDSLNVTDFHAYDGFVGLTALNYEETICKVVAFHTYSDLLAKLEDIDIYKDFYLENKYKLSELEIFCIYLISLCDMQVNSLGENVTMLERVRDVEQRFGISNPKTVHIKKVMQILYAINITDKLQ